MITPRHDRLATLLAAGVPDAFLRTLHTLAEYGSLEHVLRPPEAAYFYLPSAYETQESLVGWSVTPICEGSNGDVFYLLLTRPGLQRFVYIEKDHDDIGHDFGEEFPPLLAHLLIDLHEFAGLPRDRLADLGQRLGFPLAASLFDALEQAAVQGLRRTAEDDHSWRAMHLPPFLLTS